MTGCRGTVIMLAVIEWDAPCQGAQILAGRLAGSCPHGYRVVFVETLGLRSAGRRDWRRLRRRLRGRARGPLRPLGDNLWLHSPVLLPWPGRRWADALNARLLTRSLQPVLQQRPLVLWTYLPTSIVHRLADGWRPERLVYHCTDDMVNNPAGISPGLLDSEDRLVRRADRVLATARGLYEPRQAKNPRTLYLPDGGEIGPFLLPAPEPADLAQLPHPRMLFFGTIGQQLELGLLARLADDHPAGSLVLVGPLKTDLGPLRGRPNVHLLGQRPHDALPGYLQHSDVLLIPYRITPYTANIHPAKTYECLATGRPLVTTDLPELWPYSGPVMVARDAAEFLAGVAAGAAEQDPALAEARREIARQNTWDQRYRVIQELVLDG